MNRAPRVLAVALSIIALPLAFIPASCSGQSEGERCDHKNGDADCRTGLVCKQSKELRGNADICCPPEGSQNPECLGGGATTGTETTGTETTTTTGETTTGETTSASTTASGSSGSTTGSTSTSSSSSGSSGSGSGGAGGAGGAGG